MMVSAMGGTVEIKEETRRTEKIVTLSLCQVFGQLDVICLENLAGTGGLVGCHL